MTEQKGFDFRRRRCAPSLQAQAKKEGKRKVRKFLELRCRGRSGATRSSVIRRTAGLPSSLTEEIVREIIRELLKEGVPVGSCSRGYFIIQSMKELGAVVKGLRARQEGIETRIRLISHAFGCPAVLSNSGK